MSAGIGALAPDIDSPKSIVGRAAMPLGMIVGFLFGHRGIFHSMAVPFVLFLSYAFFLPSVYLLAFIFGYMSHLILDAITPEGVRLLHPFSRLHVRGFVSTGGLAEVLVFLMIAAGIVFRGIAIL